jgi:hypothetical protein
MADNFSIGAGLHLDGEQAFKKAITDINKDLSVLSSEMKKVTAQFDDNSNSMEALTAKQKVYNDRADEQRKKIEVMTAALESAKKEYGENSDQVKNWQIKLNNAEADLAKTEKSLKDTTNQIDNFGKEADDSGKEVEKAGKKAKDSGDDAKKGGDGWEKLGNTLGGVATAAGVAVAALATAAAGAAVAAVKMASDAAKAGAEYADNVNTIAAQTGLTTDEVQQLQYQADMVDVSLETVTGSMAKLTKNMGTAQGGTGDAADAFKALGIEITNADGSLRNNQDVFNEAIDALGKMENETQRDAYAMQIFGKSAQDLNPLILAGSDTLNQFAKDAKDSGYILSGEALTALNDYQDSLDKIAKQKDALSNAIGVAAAPAFKVFTDGADDALKALTKLINGDISAEDFAAQIGDAVAGIADYITEALPKFMEAGQAILETVVTAITQNLPTLLNAAMPIITTLVTGITQMLPTLVMAAIPILQALINGIVQSLPTLIPAIVALVLTITQTIIDNLPLLVDAALTLITSLANGLILALPELIPKIVEVVVTIAQKLIDNIPLLIDAALQLVIGLAEGIIAAIPVIIEALPELITSLIEGLLEAIPQIIEAGITLLVALVEALPEIIATIVKALPKIIKGIITALTDNLPLIIDAGVKLFIALIENLPLIIVEIVKAIPQIIEALVEGFGEFFGTMGEIGLDLIKGLWQGISDAGEWLWNKISGFFNGVVSRIKDFFGIHSPSTLFAGLGGNMAQGLGEGFGAEMQGVAKQINDSIPTSFDSQINATARMGEGIVNGMAAVMGTQGGSYTINVNLDGQTAASVLFDPLRGVIKQKGVALA